MSTLLHGYANPLKRLDTSESVNLHKCLILLDSCRIHATRCHPVFDEAVIAAIAEATTVSVTGALPGLRTVLPTLQEAITTLRVQLYAEKERADRAERRVVELRAQLARRWWQVGRRA